METSRGRFRNVEMDEIEKWRDHPQWDDEPSRNSYRYPLEISRWQAAREGKHLAIGNPPDETYRRQQFFCVSSPESHFGPWRWAVDFLVPDGTPVVAAADGRIVEAQERGTLHGNGPEFRDHLNYVTLEHAGGEFSQYCHLAPGSVSTAGSVIGNRVKCGQRVGTVGKTGWTDRDHLHFVVFRSFQNPSPAQFKSVRPRFRKSWLWF